MPDLDQTVALAKQGKLSRAEIYAGMQSLAEQRRGPGQSEHQAFSKFISGEGRELYQVMASLPGREIETARQAPMSITKLAPSGGWHDLIAGLKRFHKREHPHDSDARADVVAVNAAMSTEEGRCLFALQKRAEQIATGQYTIADMACLDGIDAERQQQDNLHKRTSQQSEFEDMVGDVMRKNLGLNRTRAGDAVRGTPSGMAAWLKHKGKPGQNGLPQDEGEVHRPPTEVPWDATNAPAVKQFGIMTQRVMKATRLPFDTAVGVVRASPEGEHVFQKMLVEMRAT